MAYPQQSSKCKDIYLLLYILHSASRSNETLGIESWRRQLELAIAWNRVDIAETEIFTEESQWKVGLLIVHYSTFTPNAREVA